MKYKEIDEPTFLIRPRSRDTKYSVPITSECWLVFRSADDELYEIALHTQSKELISLSHAKNETIDRGFTIVKCSSVIPKLDYYSNEI